MSPHSDPNLKHVCLACPLLLGPKKRFGTYNVYNSVLCGVSVKCLGIKGRRTSPFSWLHSHLLLSLFSVTLYVYEFFIDSSECRSQVGNI